MAAGCSGQFLAGLLPRRTVGGLAEPESSFDDGPVPNQNSKAIWNDYASRIIGGLSLIALLVGTVVYRVLEDWGWVDAFYFSAVTLTTVGFGDFTPTTAASKIFTVFYIFSGISLIGLFLNQWLKHHATRLNKRVNPD